ncbi:MAG: transcriptional repressor [Epsilonproteobacteria bacterium]|nr:transcriptional repressor [Campylobacterota bacterium]
MQNYKTRLKEYRLKATPQRMYMIEEIEKRGHIDIDTLYESLKNIFPYISLATVYKNINSMTENGFLTEVKIPKLKTRYELSKEDHAHLLCRECGKLTDISVESEPMTKNAQLKSGYKIEKTLVTFEGICPACQKKDKGK